jgi:hypothetical protein
VRHSALGSPAGSESTQSTDIQTTQGGICDAQLMQRQQHKKPQQKPSSSKEIGRKLAQP